MWHFIFRQLAIGVKQFRTAFENCCLDRLNGHKKYLSLFLPRIHRSGIVSMLLSQIFFSAFKTENILIMLFSFYFSDLTLKVVVTYEVYLVIPEKSCKHI